MAGFWSSTFGGGNSFEESVANTFTPGDGYSYERGDLINESTGKVATKADRDASGKGSADNEKTNRAAYESSPRVPEAKNNPDGSSTDRPVTGIQSLLPMLGGMALGPVGVAAGLTYNRYNTSQSGGQSGNNATSASNKLSSDPALTNYAKRFDVPSITKEELKKARESGNRIQGSFYKDGDTSKQFKMNMFGNSYEIDTDGQNAGNSKLIREQAEAAGGEGGIATVRPVATQPTAPTSTMPAISTESQFAKQQMVSPPAEWLIANGYADTNPSYDALVKYNTDLRAGIVSMARGGEVEFALGGNEKDLINAAERAVRNGLQVQGMARGGDMDISNEDKIAIAQYVKQYGKPALMQLVDSVRTGEADETRKRFASGENGEVRGNGDGSGTDDKITAQLKDGDATQDVLLADGEFVLRKDAYEALKGAGVNVDKVNDAGSNAAKELNKMMTA